MSRRTRAARSSARPASAIRRSAAPFAPPTDEVRRAVAPWLAEEVREAAVREEGKALQTERRARSTGTGA